MCVCACACVVKLINGILLYLEIERENDLFHQRTFSQTLKSLLNCVTDEMQLHPLEMSFAQELLDKIHKDKIIREIKSLSTEIIFHKTLNGTAFTEECGNVYVSEVDVICKKKQLCVIQKVCNFIFNKHV